MNFDWEGLANKEIGTPLKLVLLNDSGHKMIMNESVALDNYKVPDFTYKDDRIDAEREYPN